MKKLHIFWGKKQIVLLSIVCSIVFLVAVLLGCLKKTELVLGDVYSHTVVIDAGHGGVDGGSVGKTTGVIERDLNLEYAKTLSGLLNQFGIGTILTRKDKNGLYDNDATNLKRSDMKKRKEIIDNSGAMLVVSIHMNSFPLKNCRGAQTFFNKENEKGKILAENIQSQFLKDLPFAKNEASIGDYYITNCTNLPAVIIECGFISNPEEEVMLATKEYREKVCYSVLCGIIGFIGAENDDNNAN